MSDIAELYEYGVKLFDKGRYLEAEGLLKEVVKHKPGYADVQNKLGIIANMNGRLEEAASCFGKAVSINPNYTEAVLNLAITYNEMGEVEKACDIFEEVRKKSFVQKGELDPYVAGKFANEHLRLGNIYLDFGLLDSAVVEYRKALDLRPGLPDIRTRLGIALRDQKRFEEAVKEFTGAIGANPSYAPAIVQLGLTYYMQGQNELARAEWERALGLNPDLKEARSLLNILTSGE